MRVVMLCPAGFEAILADAARQELPKFALESESSGFICGRTVAPVRQLRGFPCATNIFAVLDEVPRSTVDRELTAFGRRLPQIERPPGLPTRGSVRLRIHDDGQFAPTNARLCCRDGTRDRLLEWPARIAKRCVFRGLAAPPRRRAKHNPCDKAVRGPWAVRPRRAKAGDSVPPSPGPNRFEARHVVMDPFAGSGAIGKACLEAGARYVWLNDVKGTQRTADCVRWTHQNTLCLAVPPGSVDVIVTDPPWGSFAPAPGGVERLYSAVGGAVARWLRPGGAIVALIGAPETAVRALVEGSELSLERLYPVLVNGRKARLIRARKGFS